MEKAQLVLMGSVNEDAEDDVELDRIKVSLIGNHSGSLARGAVPQTPRKTTEPTVAVFR